MNDDDFMSDAVRDGIKELFSTETPLGMYLSTVLTFMIGAGDDAAKKEELLSRLMSDCIKSGIKADHAAVICQVMVEAVTDHHRQQERAAACLRTN